MYTINYFDVDKDEELPLDEDGKIISYNPVTALYTINYFDVDKDQELPLDEDGHDLSVYETLVIDLEGDYLKHEIRFL